MHKTLNTVTPLKKESYDSGGQSHGSIHTLKHQSIYKEFQPVWEDKLEVHITHCYWKETKKNNIF